jgi:succinyl-CoA synthetase beta subunit
MKVFLIFAKNIEMNLHEYQGKSILKSYGVAVQEGIVVDKVEDAVAAAKKLSEETGTSWFVVKAQIHAGGRGKGTVEETGSHGVVIAKGLDQVEEKVAAIQADRARRALNRERKLNKAVVTIQAAYRSHT